MNLETQILVTLNTMAYYVNGFMKFFFYGNRTKLYLKTLDVHWHIRETGSSLLWASGDSW